MLLKLGVDISRLNREIRRALNVIEKVYQARGIEPVITSTYEGNHSAGSYHYANDAVDIRLIGDDDVVAEILRRELITLKMHFGFKDNFLVLVEGSHIHIQYTRM